MNVKEITEVKQQMDLLKDNGILTTWTLPYENLLTRLDAAIFFLTPSSENEETMSVIWDSLGRFKNFSWRINEEKKLSNLKYRVTFSSEEKEKNSTREQREIAGGAGKD